MMTHDQLDAQTSPALSRWLLRTSGTNRRWAMRIDSVTTAEIKAGCKLFLHADSDEELKALLQAEEQRITAAVRTR